MFTTPSTGNHRASVESQTADEQPLPATGPCSLKAAGSMEVSEVEVHNLAHLSGWNRIWAMLCLQDKW